MKLLSTLFILGIAAFGFLSFLKLATSVKYPVEGVVFAGLAMALLLLFLVRFLFRIRMQKAVAAALNSTHLLHEFPASDTHRQLLQTRDVISMLIYLALAIFSWVAFPEKTYFAAIFAIFFLLTLVVYVRVRRQGLYRIIFSETALVFTFQQPIILQWSELKTAEGKYEELYFSRSDGTAESLLVSALDKTDRAEFTRLLDEKREEFGFYLAPSVGALTTSSEIE